MYEKKRKSVQGKVKNNKMKVEKETFSIFYLDGNGNFPIFAQVLLPIRQTLNLLHYGS